MADPKNVIPERPPPQLAFAGAIVMAVVGGGFGFLLGLIIGVFIGAMLW